MTHNNHGRFAPQGQVNPALAVKQLHGWMHHVQLISQWYNMTWHAR
jgi:hypothetical protein